MDIQNLSVSKLDELFNQPYRPIASIEKLRCYIQNAVTLEFATIPAYTNAMFSMQDKSGDAYHLTASVAMEEMFHVYQAANLLVSVGGIPRFTAGYAPEYPTFIPNADKKSTPYISLRPASLALYQDVFMAIETPATFESPPEDKKIQTIGQFYKAIEDGIVFLEKDAQSQNTTIFCNTPGYAQHQNYYFGKGGGYIVDVKDLDSAKKAIQQIVQQGEGAVQPGKTLVPTQDWGAYNHYGKRVDGQYGPIIGTPVELSHYFKFKQIADGNPSLPEIYPIVAVPDMAHYLNPRAQKLAQAFNIVYSELLRNLELSFKEGSEGRHAFFEKTVKLMHHQLPRLADQLMQTCIWVEGNSAVGPNASPTWQYIDAPLALAKMLIDEVMQEVQCCEAPEGKLEAFMTINATLNELDQCQ